LFRSFCGRRGTVGQSLRFAACPEVAQPAKVRIPASNSSRPAIFAICIDLFFSGVGGVTGTLCCHDLLAVNLPQLMGLGGLDVCDGYLAVGICQLGTVA